jgi:hypothetical protein
MTLTEAQFRNDIVKNGIAQVGHLYRDSAVPTNWPPAQFDCSTFVHWLLAKYGVDLDHGKMETLAWPPLKPNKWHKYEGYTLTQQSAAKAHVASVISYSALKPGDLLYYDKPGQHHVVMYIGGSKVVHAAGTAYGVIVSPVVGPGHVGFGGKTLTMCVSVTKFAAAVGYKFAPAGAPKPKPPVVPVTRPTVFLSHIIAAINKDGPAAQGHTTYKREVLLVEDALAKEDLLAHSFVDGSAGTTTFGPHNSAYQKWQARLGYHGTDADGIPGITSLRNLGAHHGWNVV